ncbi:MAG: tetratricopeptide repeat protein, partial [Gammaproteobacteria bacterium]|nr:tetratricopeptide repeat protein [Gammaproteobacteria bacterium]
MINPDNSPASAQQLVEKGELAFQNNNFSEAYQLFVKAIDADPGHTQAYNNLASFYFLQGKLQESIEIFEFIIDYLEPTNLVLENYIAALNKAGQNEKVQLLQDKLQKRQEIQQAKKRINVVTSIAPRNLEMQRLCIRS